jgi:hypothetical protein
MLTAWLNIVPLERFRSLPSTTLASQPPPVVSLVRVSGGVTITVLPTHTHTHSHQSHRTHSLRSFSVSFADNHDVLQLTVVDLDTETADDGLSENQPLRDPLHKDIKTGRLADRRSRRQAEAALRLRWCNSSVQHLSRTQRLTSPPWSLRPSLTFVCVYVRDFPLFLPAFLQAMQWAQRAMMIQRYSS